MATTDISKLYTDRKYEALTRVYDKINKWKKEIYTEVEKSSSNIIPSMDSGLEFFNEEGYKISMNKNNTKITFAIIERISSYKKTNKYSPESALAQLISLENIILEQLKEI